LRQFKNDIGELTVTGELVNFTGSTQTLNTIGGEFFDESGTKIAGDDNISDYWLTDNIPPNGRLPFELTIDNIQTAADFSLTANAEPASGNVRTEFSVNITSQTREFEYYCLEGVVTLDTSISDYLEIIATGYATDGTVISFNDDYYEKSDISGSSVEFLVCLDDTDPPTIDHHALQVWGE